MEWIEVNLTAYNRVFAARLAHPNAFRTSQTRKASRGINLLLCVFFLLVVTGPPHLVHHGLDPLDQVVPGGCPVLGATGYLSGYLPSGIPYLSLPLFLWTFAFVSFDIACQSFLSFYYRRAPPIMTAA